MSRKCDDNFACLGIVGATSAEAQAVQGDGVEVPHTGSEGHGQRLTRGLRRMRNEASGGYYKANEALTGSVDGGRAADIVYPDCSEAFDSFPQLPSGILLHSGVDKWLVGRMGKWVTGHTQRVVANSSL
ncbi:hypothetical protein QYF61_010076 [Mycteria americana]|uniref:Uncharacterized protein n=1 Tax=Mycteria americana TaxID=33587 RepID=A0AAN7MWQ0_MYCAM|nr:hypothetical protein QYF61_010076 [Mycteria americana]